ncbi:Synerg-CTERM sorting domain-containing protein [Aminiphilus circumscriptus]|uniref:Synerg-CTERM sorting domain-containing protein n=1 Tax=Aminiphilus circumscriptus TaxID=290732 RepID=UPI00049258FF|nr:Synerg-CTERM sorting domain-containing protein [Aminiphilus circumscriptus]
MKKNLAILILAFLAVIFGGLTAWGGGYKYDILCDTASIEDRTSEAKESFPSCTKAIMATGRPGTLFLEFEPKATYQDEGSLQPPTNLRTMGWFGSIMLYWNTPEGQEDDNVEIWESQEDDLSTAELIATVSGRTNSYERYLGSFQGRYYWVRAISRTGLVSDWNSRSGTYGYSEQESHSVKKTDSARVFTVYAKKFDGSFVEIYQTESENDINWYSFNIAQDSGYDLVHGDNTVTGYVVLCSELKEAPTPTGSESYPVAGTWYYEGSGTINGYSASDQGRVTVQTSGNAGSETITYLSFSGTMKNEVSGQTAPYSYSMNVNIPFDGDFSITYDGITQTFTQTSERTMTATANGKQSSTGYTIHMSYTADKQETAGGSSGGGCSLGVSPLALFLLVPVWLLKR